MTRIRRTLTLAGLLALMLVPAAGATHKPQPAIDTTKIAYDPVGHFKAGDPIPADFGKACDEVKPLLKDGLFNPSGKWNAHDMSIFEVYCLPYRNQGDTSDADPMGNGGEPRHGYCAGAPPAGDVVTNGDDVGQCPNHQLEYIAHFKRSMEAILGDFGVSFDVHEYAQDDATCRTPPCTGRLPIATVAGGDHPEQHILIGSHFDQTDTGPASVWDSQEGHAEMIRIAKIMADYWRATGTRPAATVKFVPMDGEEDGLLGSEEYVNNVIAPEGEGNVRGYFNADPCAGGYPAFHYGGANRIDMGIQLGVNPDQDVQTWNSKVQGGLVEGIFDRIDDVLENRAGFELFVSTAEGLPGIGGDIGRDVFVGFESPVLFGSDWMNFIGIGIPIFNPTPKVTGPQRSEDNGLPEGPQSVLNPPEGVYQFHTPLDNWQTMSRYSGQDPAGGQYSEAYIKGMEFCSSMLAEGMLQPEMGGTQAIDTKPVAHFTALPNEAQVGNFVHFNGSASHQYADTAYKLVPREDLQLAWDFGDGTATAYGDKVKHAYRRAGTYTAKLTVTNRSTKEASTMTLPIVVEEGTGTDNDPADQFTDRVPAKNSVVACQSTSAFTKVSVRPSGKGLKFDFERTNSSKPVTIDVFQATKGKSRRIARFANKTETFTWKGKRGLRRGHYFVRVTGLSTADQRDERFFAFTRTSKKFKTGKAYTRSGSCDLVSLFRLSTPAFGKALTIGVVTTKNAAVEVRVLKGRKLVKRFRAKSTANRALNFKLSGKRLKRGVYKIALKATADGKTSRDTLVSRRL